MGYIDRNLLPQEQIIFRTRKSLVLFFYPVLLTAFSFFATKYMMNNDILSKVIWVPWAVTAILWFSFWLSYISSEYAITDKRVMMREGVFHRHANEIRIATISQVNVDQSLAGQMLNYGTVSISTFGAFDAYPMIARPILFQKYLNSQLDKVAR